MRGNRALLYPVLLSVAVCGLCEAAEDATRPRPSLNTLLSSGVPASFSLPASSTDFRLFNGDQGFRVIVPAGATQLQVRLATTTPGVDVDLYLRSGTDVALAFGFVAADHYSEGLTGDETILVGPSSEPPLRASTYYIALGLYGPTSTMVTGTVTATVTGGGGGGGGGTRIDVSPTAADFGSVVPGQSKDTTIVVRNLGSTSLGISLITSSNPRFSVVSPTVPFTVAAGGQQVVTIRFAPLAAGLQTGAITIVSNDPVRPNVSVSIQGTGSSGGTGAQSAAINIPSSLNFGDVAVGQSKQMNLAVRNSGGALLTVTSVSSSAQQFNVRSPVTPFRVEPGQEQAVVIQFQPSATGSQSATLTIASNDPLRPISTIQLSGNAVPAISPAISVSSTSLNFLADGGSSPAPQTLIVRSASGETLDFVVTTNQAWIVASPSRGTSSGVGATVSVTVNASGLNPGTHRGEIRIADSSAVPSGPPPVGSVAVSVLLTITYPSATPLISRGGVVNAASFALAASPEAGIARGSIFSLFGLDLGPPRVVSAASFPLPATLGGVMVRIIQGGTVVDAIPLAVFANQINAIMPSTAPLGDVLISVTVNGRTGPGAPARVVDSGFGIFTVNQSGMGPGVIQNFISQAEQPLNSTLRTARPRQFVTLWGTGLGPIAGPDNLPPQLTDVATSVEIFVGSRRVTNKLFSGRAPCCAGLDQIVFEIPADAPSGCFVPVYVRAGNVNSNMATIAVEPEGRPCSDPANAFSRIPLRGGKQGVISLVRIAAREEPATGDSAELVVDLGGASFVEERGNEFGFHPLWSLPPLGTCSVYAGAGLDLRGLLSGQLPLAPIGGRVLNAGSTLTVTGSSGVRAMRRSADGTYFTQLGGAVPGQAALPLFLEDLLPGRPDVPVLAEVIGEGASDVGPFYIQIRVPPRVQWTNRDQMTAIDRQQDLTLTWTGGDPASQAVTILGGSVDPQAGVSGTFLCRASLEAGTFVVPAAVLASLPPSGPRQPGRSAGFLFLEAGPNGNAPVFTASGLDAGFLAFRHLNGIGVTYR